MKTVTFYGIAQTDDRKAYHILALTYRGESGNMVRINTVIVDTVKGKERALKRMASLNS